MAILYNKRLSKSVSIERWLLAVPCFSACLATIANGAGQNPKTTWSPRGYPVSPMLGVMSARELTPKMVEIACVPECVRGNKIPSWSFFGGGVNNLGLNKEKFTYFKIINKTFPRTKRPVKKPEQRPTHIDIQR